MHSPMTHGLTASQVRSGMGDAPRVPASAPPLPIPYAGEPPAPSSSAWEMDMPPASSLPAFPLPPSPATSCSAHSAPPAGPVPSAAPEPFAAEALELLCPQAPTQGTPLKTKSSDHDLRTGIRLILRSLCPDTWCSPYPGFGKCQSWRGRSTRVWLRSSAAGRSNPGVSTCGAKTQH